MAIGAALAAAQSGLDIVFAAGTARWAAASVALGFAAGLLLHRLPWLRAAAEPVLGSFYAVLATFLTALKWLLLRLSPAGSLREPVERR